ncbi:MAG TPA: L,D-transpeptidase, partial [Pyrinomonadaceae bacterium]|nr:L,D-transpeptidase [Pyrinomonadaceae bacterium]
MKKKSGALGAVMGLFLCLLTFGCEVPNTTITTTTNVNTNAAPSPPPAPAAEPTRANNASVTLPVLDAFFADESFAGELKSKLQLSDDQIAKLRVIAREETAGLRESENEEYGGTTDAARARYQQKIEAEIGPEKARALSDLLLTRWNNGEGPHDGGETAATTTVAPGKSGGIPSDTRIVVNAPAYRMDVFESGQLTKSYKIGIGYPEFPLPTGMRKADTIIFNPTWTPPDEPWVEAPSSKVKVGEKVEAGSPLNPLGPIKIPIGLPSLIHGGKQPARLGNFASHGCVGLTNNQVQEFAQTLAKLTGTEITPEQLAGYQKNKTETKNVKLEKTIPVELRYDTIV